MDVVALGLAKADAARKYVSALTSTGSGDQTARINAALSALSAFGIRKTVRLVGAFTISAPLVIPSNTVLDAQDAVITLADGSNCNMLRNAGVTPQRVLTDVAWSYHSTTLTSASANFTSADVGRTISVVGAFAGGYAYPLIVNIVSVTSPTQVTVSAQANAPVSGATASIYQRDRNIEVRGGVWNRGANGWTVSEDASADRMGFQFKHLDGLHIRDLEMSCSVRGYNIGLGDLTEYTVRNIRFDVLNTVVNTDGVNVHGPAHRGVIDQIFGTTGDDFVSLHTIDADPLLQDTIGDVTSTVVTNLFPYRVGQAAFKAHGGANTTSKIGGLTVRGVHGSALGGAINIRDYTAPGSNSFMTNTLIEDVDCATATGKSLVALYMNSPTCEVTLRDLVWRTPQNGNPSVVYVPSGSTLRRLSIDGLTVEAGNGVFPVQIAGTVDSLSVSRVAVTDPAITIASIVEVLATGAVKEAVVNDVSAYLASGSTVGAIVNRGTLSKVTGNAINLIGGGRVLNTVSGATPMTVTLGNVTLDGATALASLASQVDLLVSGLNVKTISGAALLALVGSGAVVSVRGWGMLNPTAVAAFTRDGTQTPKISHPDMRVDVSQVASTGLGDTAYNTNAALACGVGTVVSLGTGTVGAWRSATALTMTPVDLGATGWTTDPAHASASATPTSGKIVLTRFRAQATTTVSRIDYFVATAGSGLTAGQCAIGLFDTGQTTAGTATLLATSDDQATNGAGTGTKTATLGSSVQLTAGQDYFVGMLWTGTTMPVLACGTTRLLQPSTITGLNLRALITTASGITTLASQTAGSLSGTSNLFGALIRP